MGVFSCSLVIVILRKIILFFYFSSDFFCRRNTINYFSSQYGPTSKSMISDIGRSGVVMFSVCIYGAQHISHINNLGFFKDRKPFLAFLKSFFDHSFSSFFSVGDTTSWNISLKYGFFYMDKREYIIF